jgi:hypothetical protein
MKADCPVPIQEVYKNVLYEFLLYIPPNTSIENNSTLAEFVMGAFSTHNPGYHVPNLLRYCMFVEDTHTVEYYNSITYDYQ